MVGAGRSVWEGFEGEKRREKCCNLNTISKISQEINKRTHSDVSTVEKMQQFFLKQNPQSLTRLEVELGYQSYISENLYSHQNLCVNFKIYLFVLKTGVFPDLLQWLLLHKLWHRCTLGYWSVMQRNNLFKIEMTSVNLGDFLNVIVINDSTYVIFL